MSYDKSKDTTKEDVKKEASEALDAVKNLFAGKGTFADAEKEVAEAAAAAADLVSDTVKAEVAAVKKYFRTRLGYQLHDGSQNVTILPHEDTPAEHTKWVQDQIDANLVVEVPGPSAAPAEEVAKPE